MSEQIRTIRNYASKLLVIIGIASVGVCVYALLFGSPIQNVQAQSDRYLESRITQMEQRFYQIESRLNRIEQDSMTRRVSPSIPADTRNQDLALFQNEISGLRVRLGEVECGLLRLDERTLTAAKRQGNRGGTGSDRCRQDWASPLQLSARP